MAAVAGVSTATVSAVVNGRASQYGICRATEEKVQAVIRQMGYAPSLSALDMVAGRNSLVGLAITADYPGADRLIAAMEPALAQAGFRLLVACLPADPVAAVARISNLARYDIGGLVIFPARALPLPGIGCPVVMVGRAGVGLPADCNPSAVNQLGQATARWLQMASQGMPPGELLLEPVPVITPTNPLPQAPSPPLRPPPSVTPVPVPNPPAVSVPAVSPVEVPPTVPEPPDVLAAPDVIPAAPVEEPTVTILEPFLVPVTVQPEVPSLVTTPPPEPTVSLGNSETEQPDNSPKLPSESIQMPEAVVIDPVGQAVTDPQGTALDESEGEPVPAPPAEPVASTSVSAVSGPPPGPLPPEPMPEPPPEPMPVSEPDPAPEVVTPPESEVSQPAPEIVPPEPRPEPIPVVIDAVPVIVEEQVAAPAPVIVEQAPIPVPEPVPASEVLPPAEFEASQPVPEIVVSEPVPEPEPVIAKPAPETSPSVNNI